MRACKCFVQVLVVVGLVGLVGLVGAGCTVTGNPSYPSGNTNVPLQRGSGVPPEAACC
jgi:hypothetical protein